MTESPISASPSGTTRLRVFATASEFWEEKLLCEIFWDGATLTTQGDKDGDVHEVNNLVGSLYHAQQGFPIHERDAEGKIRRDEQGKIIRLAFVSRATHSPSEVLDALAENLELRQVYRVQRQ